MRISDWSSDVCSSDLLEKLVAFWSSVVLTSGRYKGNTMAAHLKHRDRITPALFDRWLGLWNMTTSEVMPPQAAAFLQEKAARIAQSLRRTQEHTHDIQSLIRISYADFIVIENIHTSIQ